MNLHELLATVGILRPADLAERLKITRQYASLLWTGEQAMSRAMAHRIAKETGLDWRQILIAEIPPKGDTPRGRRPKS